MAVPADRVARILGLKSTVRSTAAIADAVESGLPKLSLERVVERSGIEGPARLKLMHRVVPAATWKRRHRLKLVESERTERLARVIALAEMLWDDEADAKRFLATPHPELGRRKPIEAGSPNSARARSKTSSCGRCTDCPSDPDGCGSIASRTPATRLRAATAPASTAAAGIHRAAP